MELTETRSWSDRDTLKSKATEVTQEVKQRGKKQLDTTKRAAADQAQQVAGVIEQASEQLGRAHQQSLARYTGEFATSIKSLADNLNNRSIDELGSDAVRLARQNPTLFLLGSVAIGFALSRFVKASTVRPEDETGAETPLTLQSRGSSQQPTPSEATDDVDVGRYPEVVVPNEIKGE
jgi:hypothetical protein